MERIESRLKKQSLYEQYKPLLKEARNKPWSVHCEPSMTKAEHVVRYLGQYTHRVAITNQRFIGVDQTTVTFMHKDYSDQAKQKPIKP